MNCCFCFGRKKLSKCKQQQMEAVWERASKNALKKHDVMAMVVVGTLNSQAEIEPNNDEESMDDQKEEEEEQTKLGDQLEGMKQSEGEFSAKMVEYQNKKQHNIDALVQKGNDALSVGIRTNPVSSRSPTSFGLALIKPDRSIVQRVAALSEIGLIPQQNRWDPAACHQSLTLSDRLIVQHNKENSGWHSVFAERQIPKAKFGIFYYQVKILREGACVYIGFAPKQMPLTGKAVGDFNGTYAYESCGRFWGHAVEGSRQSNNSRPYIEGMPSFRADDVIGCGVDLATGQIIYTNGRELLETAGLFVDSTAELFPCVTLFLPGAQIQANFGPDFFKIADGI